MQYSFLALYLVTKFVVNSSAAVKYRNPVICDKNTPCPDGSSCYKVYGDIGLCVLNK